MTIPTLSTSDKSFICSYSIGANIDFRLASGVINEIDTYTTEYIEGKCWIPVFAPIETNDESYFWDKIEKDVVYVKVGCRISVDGYLHTWLLSTQKVSELILWNNRYDTTNQPEDDITILHWAIEKLYMQVIGNTTGFISANIKFQNYIGGAIRLYLFGTYSNSITNGVSYSIDHPINVLESSVTWYPNNSSSIFGDILYSTLAGSTQECDKTYVGTDHLMDDTFGALILHEGALDPWEDWTDEANSNSGTNCPLFPENTISSGNIYIGNSCKFIGVEFDIIQTIGGSPVSTWLYWNGDIWVNLPNLANTTNGFKSTGIGVLTFNEPKSWEKTTINDENMYFIRGVTWGASTRQPLMRVGHIIRPDGWVNFGDNFSNEVEPVFYKRTPQTGSVDIVSVCHPYEPFPPTMYRQWEDCHIRDVGTYVGFGNNSGRQYLAEDLPSCVTCDTIPCLCTADKYLRMSMEPNRKYIFVDSYCNGASGSTQLACESNGGTWVPQHYECDPSFIYDSLVTYNIDRWVSAPPAHIDYSEGRANFECVSSLDQYLAVFWEKTTLDTFSEYLDEDLDELKHINFIITNTGVVINEIRSIFTKHVGVGLITFSTAPTFYTVDWIINWGLNDYFDSWVPPDGLVLRDPGSTKTLLIRPITHHDEFYTDTTDIEGGFLYDTITSNAFLSRDPGTEIKIMIPLCHDDDFNWLYKYATSNGFLLRDPGMETKIIIPISNNCDFNWVYKFVTSHGFVSRDPGIETKIEIPLSNNCDFSWFYKLIKPKIAILYHLKTDGDDTKDGLSWDNAWQHWTYMAQNIPGDYTYTVLVEEGVYNDNETQIGPDNSVVVYLVKNGLNDVSTVVVTLA